MADRSYPSVRIFNFQHDCVLVAGHFSATVAGVTALSRFGNGFTVVRTALGRFTITTDDGYRHVVASGCQYCATTPTDWYLTPIPQGGGAGAAVTWEIQLWDNTAGAIADPTVNTDEIHFWMLLSNSQLDRAAWT